MTILSRIALGLCLPSLPLAAQELQGRDFYPANYGAEVFVDFGALKDNGIWAGFERSLVAPAFALFDQHFGFALGDLEEMRLFPDVSDGEDGAGDGELMLFRGTDRVGLPTMGLRNRPHEILKVGELEVMRDTVEGDYYVSPRTGLLVFGREGRILPVVRGERKGGVPSAELLSLTSGRGNLAYAVVPIPEDALDEIRFPGLPEDWLVPEDPPTLIAVRLWQEGDEEAGYRITVQATVRHQDGSAGPARLKSLLEEGLQWLQGHARLGAFKRYWKAVRIGAEGRDLVASLDLGSPREAAGTLPLMLGPLFLLGAADAAPAAAPAPARPKKDGGKG